MEVYVDDLQVNSKKPEQRLSDLQEAFIVLRWYQMKLNSLKCTFGLELSKFLGFIVSEHGIEASLEKVETIVGMPFPTTFMRSKGSPTGW